MVCSEIPFIINLCHLETIAMQISYCIWFLYDTVFTTERFQTDFGFSFLLDEALLLITLNAYFSSLRGEGGRLLVNSTFFRGQHKTSASKKDGTLVTVVNEWRSLTGVLDPPLQKQPSRCVLLKSCSENLQ